MSVTLTLTLTTGEEAAAKGVLCSFPCGSGSRRSTVDVLRDRNGLCLSGDAAVKTHQIFTLCVIFTLKSCISLHINFTSI